MSDSADICLVKLLMEFCSNMLGLEQHIQRLSYIQWVP